MNRDPETGKFIPGNKAAAGHARPHAARIAELRATLFEVLTPDRLRGVLEAMIAAAEAGDTAAGRLILSYALGTPEATDVIERLEEVEAAIYEYEKTA